MAKALFIPLKAEYFDAFADGSKREELRLYGPRWNERTCAIGRRVTLSRGYGRHQRLSGRIWKFKRQHGSTFGSTYRAAIERLYGTLDVWIACISIELADEVCLGCGALTAERDCGCPAGTGMVFHGRPPQEPSAESPEGQQT